MTNLINLYHDLNKEFFGHSLPTITVVWNSRLKRALVRCHYLLSYSSFKLVAFKIDIQTGLTGESLRKTMVHEMCHVWAVNFFQEKGHGKQFWKKMAECGYPDGHRVEDGSQQDKWVFCDRKEFRVGDKVEFYVENLNRNLAAVVLRVNKRTVSVSTATGTWRVSPGLLSKIQPAKPIVAPVTPKVETPKITTISTTLVDYIKASKDRGISRSRAHKAWREMGNKCSNARFKTAWEK